MDDAWLPPEERSLKRLEQKQSPVASSRSYIADESRCSGKRRGIAVPSMPPVVKAVPSQDEIASQVSTPRGSIGSGSRDSSPSHSETDDCMQKRRLDKSFEEVAESHGSDEEEDRDSDHGALPQIIPELPIIMPAEAVIRRPSAMKALQIELMVLQRELEEATCKVHLVDSDLFNWEVELTGPEESPYQGGIFRFLLKFPPDYPEHMPRIRCATPVFHCNIDRNGNVCLGTFDENGLSPAALVPRIDDGSIDQFLRTQLRIAVISARGLRNADFGGASDPYCTCQVPEKDWTRFQTAVIEDSMNPVWNEEHIINDYTTGDPLDFEIFDDDDGDDELLGRCTLNSEAFYPEGFDGEVALSDTGKTQTSKLRVKVSVVMPPRVQDRTTALDIVEALLSLLTLPVLQHPLVPAAARLFIDDRQQYDRVARDWTLQYAL